MITRHIADLLYHHECVIVPGLGGFIKAYSPARIVPDTHEIYPPSGSIVFNAELSGNDGLLANHIASVENTSYREALYENKQWVDTCLISLKQGNRVVISGIGELFLNASGKIEFAPSNLINFNADSFGLSILAVKSSSRNQFNVSDIQPRKSTSKGVNLRRLIPETLKWAAVLAPFVAFVLWGSFKGNIIDNYVHNYTGMYSWVRSTPGKTAPVNIAAYPVQANQASVEIIQSSVDFLGNSNIEVDPGAVSYSELAKYNITIENAVSNETVSSVVGSNEYHIVGGAFKESENALKLVNLLKEQGYQASIIDTNARGLFIVSMQGFSDMKKAETQLGIAKQTGFSASWIYKMHKR